MKSAMLLEPAATPHASGAGIPLLPVKETGRERFGAILDEATADRPPREPNTENAGAAPANENREPAKKKKKDDVISVAPLVCSCPPPDIEPTQNSPTDRPTGSKAPAQVDASANAQVQSSQTAPGAITPTNELDISAVADPLTDIVEPKDAQPKEGSKITGAGKDSGSLKLDAKLFEPVTEEATPVDLTKISQPKSLGPQRTEVGTAAHGTLAAQLENSVKKTEKTAEFAPANEQNMPVREVSRRTAADLSRVESFHADKQSGQLLTANFEPESSEIIPVKSLEMAHLVETIRTEVTSLRQRNETTMTVVLRPDSGTQLSLDVSIARDGTIHAQARCERGDFQTLHSQWPQLQQSLAAHGIHVADLSNQNNPRQEQQRSPDTFQNFERGRDPQQRDQRDLPNFEDRLTASKIKLSPVNLKPQSAATASTTRRWQSWA